LVDNRFGAGTDSNSVDGHADLQDCSGIPVAAACIEVGNRIARPVPSGISHA
jgi:hypothetical protein